MSPDRLERARRRIEALRPKGSLKATELQRIAGMLGLVLLDQGSEPNWGDPAEGSAIRVVAIPDHGRGRDLKWKTGQSVLDGLEAALDERLRERERHGHEGEEKD